VLVRPVAEAKHDVFEVVEPTLAFAEREGFVGQILHELDGVVGRLAFAVRGHDEEDGTVGRYLV
jgi:hypothetical protein